jgi:hypothetical protein
MSSRWKFWTVTGLALAFVIGAQFIDWSREYCHTEFYADTAIVSRHSPNPTVAAWGFGPQQGPVTLVIRSGRPHATNSSRHPWVEVLSMELPAMPVVGAIDLAGGQMKVGYFRWTGYDTFGLGDKGVRGSLSIVEVDTNRIVADYNLVVDAFDYQGSFLPDHRHREVVIRGRAVFSRRLRPDAAHTAGEGRLFAGSAPAGR